MSLRDESTYDAIWRRWKKIRDGNGIICRLHRILLRNIAAEHLHLNKFLLQSSSSNSRRVLNDNRKSLSLKFEKFAFVLQLFIHHRTFRWKIVRSIESRRKFNFHWNRVESLKIRRRRSSIVWRNVEEWILIAFLKSEELALYNQLPVWLLLKTFPFHCIKLALVYCESDSSSFSTSRSCFN